MARLRQWLTLDMVWLAAALCLLALRPLLSAVPPYDFWWHMATGRVIDATGSVPQSEIFSWTLPGAPYYNQPWAAQWLMFKLYALGGLPLMLILQALLICCSYGGLLWLGLRRLGDAQRAPRRLRRAVAALLLLIVPASFDNWSIRPQTYAVPLFVATLAIVTAYRLGWRNRLWLLPPILALWANVHGSFVLGLGLIGLAWLGELATRLLHARRPELVRREGLAWRGLAVLAAWGAASGLATLLNPRGAGLLGYVSNLLSSPQVANLVTEWQPTYRTIYGVFFFGLLAVTLWMMWRARPDVDLTDLLMLLPFIYLGVTAQRNVLWFALVAYMPLLCGLAARAKPIASPPFQGQPALNGILIGFLGFLLLLSLPWVKVYLPLPPEGGNLVSSETPVGAVPALRALPPAERPERLFTELGMGSYLTWAAPEQKVFIDPRFELYPLKLWNDYDAIIAVSKPELLDSYQIDGVLVSQKTEPELVGYLRGQPAWRELWTGDGLNQVGVLFVRR